MFSEGQDETPAGGISVCVCVFQNGEVGPVWEYTEPQLDCVVADPKKGSKMYGLKSYIEYQVTPNVSPATYNIQFKTIQ